ncbi:MAG: DUF4065 domain-containing protein [Spirochaetaceae bacterium]|jgi:uncharacterized phage-associated protein|nr:DUF4065 domain-containing protein [Spirochaetaceae bacterium]
MATARDIAGYILQLAKAVDAEGGYDLITNMKLQKLVYYCQGFFLAFYDKPLFDESIEAWEHGPVCPPLYQEFKAYGATPIPINSDSYTDKLTDEEMKLIGLVFGEYGQYTAWRLREMTHQESPWIETPLGQIIPLDKMKIYFKTRVVDED